MKRFVTAAVAGLVALAIALALNSCSTQPTLGTMSLRLTDAPGAFDAVNLVIEEVTAHRAGAGDTGGWEVLSATPGTYDLLTLRNGVFAELAVASIPAGHYDQLRLKLGEGSTVVVDGVTYPLVIPSGMSSGLKLKGDFDVPNGGGLELGIDFDAAQSIHQTGNGTWMLEPVVRVMPMAGAGAIAGRVQPMTVPSEVTALLGGIAVASTAPAADGAFQLSMLPPGSYNVLVHPVNFYEDAMVEDVAVTAGATTDIGTIQLQGPD